MLKHTHWHLLSWISLQKKKNSDVYHAAPSGREAKVKVLFQFQSKPSGSEKFRDFQKLKQASLWSHQVGYSYLSSLLWLSSAVLLWLIENVTSAGKQNHTRSRFERSLMMIFQWDKRQRVPPQDFFKIHKARFWKEHDWNAARNLSLTIPLYWIAPGCSLNGIPFVVWASFTYWKMVVFSCHENYDFHTKNWNKIIFSLTFFRWNLKLWPGQFCLCACVLKENEIKLCKISKDCSNLV